MINPQPPAVPSKPLAAYRLGLLSRTLRIHQDLFRQMPQFEWGTAAGVCFAFEQLGSAVLALANDVSRNVYVELRDWLKDQAALWDAVHVMTARFSSSGDPTSDDPSEPVARLFRPSSESWNQELVEKALTERPQALTTLADLALVGLAALKDWYGLGVTLGEHLVQVHSLEDLASLPTLAPFLSACRNLEASAVVPPIILVLLQTAEKQPSLQTRDLLTQALVVQETRDEISRYGPDYDAYVVNRLLLQLDDQLQDALAGGFPAVSAVADAQSGGGLKPHWDNQSGELRWHGQIVRVVKPKATNVIALLDAFQQQGWPTKIENPVARPLDPKFSRRPQEMYNSTRLHDTIKSLNTGLTGLRFNADGTGGAVCWRSLSTS